jgi:hypothetical protein
MVNPQVAASLRGNPLSVMSPDSALEMDNCALIEGRAWRNEGAEANNLKGVCGAWLSVDNFMGDRFNNRRLQAATSRRPICLRSGRIVAQSLCYFEWRNPE